MEVKGLFFVQINSVGASMSYEPGSHLLGKYNLKFCMFFNLYTALNCVIISKVKFNLRFKQTLVHFLRVFKQNSEIG